jgi:hypothetical protein
MMGIARSLHDGSLDYALAGRKLCDVGAVNASSFTKPCPDLFQEVSPIACLASHGDVEENH